MGTERDATTERCMCGAGTVLIETSSPDHPRGGRSTYAAEFQCEQCVREYVIEDGGVVRRVDHERRADAEGEFAAARNELMTSEWVTELLRHLAAYLDQKPSKAAIYRCLDHHGLAGYSQSHFTQKWRGGTDWVSRILNLPAFSVPLS
jgi:hypothetical protein